VSLPIGTVKLTERFIGHDPPLPEEVERLSAFVREQVDPARLGLGPDGSGKLSIVGTAGTVTTLAAILLGLKEFDKKRIHGMVVSLPTLREWRERLLHMTAAERKGVPGMVPGREDVLPQGVVLMEEVVAAFGCARFTVSTAGARYGVLYEALRNRRAPQQ
jgi:exopolyphosphatase/guanosine-5'-triphosphate,3'-diphosphate pyrophosphatase